MAKRNKFKRQFRYECSITGEQVVTNTEAKNPKDLMTVSAYYELNSEEDDRPENIKQEMANRAELFQKLTSAPEQQ